MGRRSSARKSQAPRSSRLLLGRYSVEDAPPLGEGGWCVVHRGVDREDGDRPVAVKTFRAQAARELGEDGVRERFAGEVRTFQALGAGPDGEAIARDLLVNLIDFSRAAPGGDEPGPAEDGQCYTILELADESLDAWLRRRAGAQEGVGAEELREVARAVAGALAWLHGRGRVHLDVKPENVMRFGSRWKLIDLDGCLQGGDAKVSRGAFTPLYAAPELAAFSLDDRSEVASIEPTGAMDVWAAGVVLLDVLVRGAALLETKASYDSAGLFEEEDVPLEGCYRWLDDPAPLDLEGLVAPGAPGAELLRRDTELRDLLRRLLDKSPAGRPTAEEFTRHAFLGGAAAAPEGGRAGVPEDAATAAAALGGEGGAREGAAAAAAAATATTEVAAAPFGGGGPAAEAAAALGCEGGGAQEGAATAAAATTAITEIADPAAAPGGGRAMVEASFAQAKDLGALPADGAAPAAAFLALFAQLGLVGDDARVLMEALNPQRKDRLTYLELLDFLYA